MADYQGKNVVIIGAGLTGAFLRGLFPRSRCDAARYGYACNAPPGLDKNYEAVERHTGGLNDEWLMAADLIVAVGIALAHHP